MIKSSEFKEWTQLKDKGKWELRILEVTGKGQEVTEIKRKGKCQKTRRTDGIY